MAFSPYDDERYTYADYRSWPNDERWELIEGIPYKLSTAPSTRHQEASWELARQIGDFLKDRECRGFSAPFDVRLPKAYESENEIETVVQPDILVVCDPKKLDEQGCKGAPDFIIEIVSKSTASRDHVQKLNLYEKHRVKEYWIVDPLYKIVAVRLMTDSGRYSVSTNYEGRGTIEVMVLPGFKIDVGKALGSGKDRAV